MIVGGITVFSLVISVVSCLLGGAFESLWVLLWLPLGFLGSFLLLAVLAFLFLWVMCQTIDTSVPREHESKFFRRMCEEYAAAIQLAVRVRVHTQGLEKIPEKGRFFLVCNHLSLADPVILLKYFKGKQVAFISKRENSSMFIVGKAMHGLMCQTVNRENDREALKTILKCIQLIKDDEVSIGVFPEGYIHKDHKLHHFRSGVFKIAQKTKVPIVVCTLKNTPQVFENMPKLKPTDVELHLVDVIAPEAYEGMTTVDLGNMVYDMMAKDLGPDMISTEEENH